ncbi:MAG: DNA-processing protein DprA [bacterium]|nr:DNA-processing protein DprA [bacterium]
MTDIVVTPGGPGYPELLTRIPVPPERLFVRGGLERQDTLAVALVGSRNPTPYGRHMARRIAGDLALAGVTVVSGLARGIDTEAHRAALRKGGRTIAVLGCGLDVDYPRGSRELKDAISGSGALLTEFKSGTPPLPGNFPSRNRIISGSSLAVVVVEAGRRSGSLITARWALDQGREVMAVPGRADSPQSAGPIDLIRDGALPVTCADDVLSGMGLELGEGRVDERISPEHAKYSPGNGPILRALGPGPRLPEELVTATGWPLPKVLASLSGLMIEGLVTVEPGGLYTLA